MITPDNIPSSYQPLRSWWDWHPDRTMNDFRTPDDKPAENEGFASKEEEDDYYLKLADIENDQLIF